MYHKRLKYLGVIIFACFRGGQISAKIVSAKLILTLLTLLIFQNRGL